MRNMPCTSPLILICVSMFAIFAVSVKAQSVQDEKNQREISVSAKPSPSPTPSQPGCAATAANTNFWIGSGGLDLSFGDGGTVMTNIGGPTSGSDSVVKVLVQPDGKIVTLGMVLNPSGLSGVDMIVTRYNTSGTLDTTFGEADPADPGSRLGYRIVVFTTGNEIPQAAALDASGNILIVGIGGIYMARLDPSGQMDPTFGTGGMVNTAISGFAPRDITVDSNGKIVIAGGEPTFMVARFNSNGTLDTTFGNGGSVSINISGAKRGGANAWSVAMQWVNGSERIVAAGSSTAGPSSPSTFALMRFTSTGARDTSFGSNGVVLTGFGGAGDVIFDHLIDSQNRIVAAGQVYNCGGLRDAGVARYLENGALDITFSGDGKLSQDIYGGTNAAWSVAVQADEKIVAGGYASNIDGTKYDFSLIRLNADGTPDATFGPGILGPGIATTDVGLTGNTDLAHSLAVQANGAILLGGSGGAGVAAVVTRYLP